MVIAYCAAVMLVAIVVLYPDAFRDANESARANARLDLLDRRTVAEIQRETVTSAAGRPQRRSSTRRLGR